jgi:hypothetical protein
MQKGEGIVRWERAALDGHLQGAFAVLQACGAPVSPTRISCEGIPMVGPHDHAMGRDGFSYRVTSACSGGVSQRGHGVLVGSMGSTPSAPATSGGRGSDLREGPQLPGRTQSGSPSAATQGAPQDCLRRLRFLRLKGVRVVVATKAARGRKRCGAEEGVVAGWMSAAVLAPSAIFAAEGSASCCGRKGRKRAQKVWG